MVNENSATIIRYEHAMKEREMDFLEKLNELRAQIAQMKVDHRREITALALENENLKALVQNERLRQRGKYQPN